MKTLNAIAILLAAGCMMIAKPAYSAGPTDDSIQNIESLLFKIIDKDALTVNFDAGQAKLTHQEVVTLRALVAKAITSEKFDRYVVAAWSDAEFPGKGVEQSFTQRSLAAKRVKAVKAALKDAGARDIDTYSFAEHPSWLGKVFNSENAQIKREDGMVKASDDKQIADLGREIRKHGGPQTAVIILVSKNELTSR